MSDEMQERFEFAEKKQQEMRDEMRQRDDALKLEFKHLLDELDADQVTTIGKMLASSLADLEVGHQLLGSISGCLMWKHDRDWNGRPGIYEQLELPGFGKDKRVVEGQVDAELEERARQMREYNLMPDPENEPYFKCTNCGKFFISLEDRMLRPPGVKGCDGCVQKAKWG